MNRQRLMKVLLAPHVSEKTTVLGESGALVSFKVVKDATKQEVKAAVELMFDVKVGDVRVLNMKGKTKRKQRGPGGRRPDWKKAYVALQAGSEIDFASTD